MSGAPCAGVAEYGVWVKGARRSGWLRRQDGAVARYSYDDAVAAARRQTAAHGALHYTVQRIPAWGLLKFNYVGVKK